MTASRGERGWFGLCAGLLVAFALAMQVIRLPEPLGIDQGLFACFARWVPRGALPYRDLFDSKPPLFLYWWSASAVIPGDVVRAAWWWEGLWLAGTLAIAYALGKRLGDRWVGLVAAALMFVGFWSPAWGDRGQPFWSRAQAEEALALPMLVSAWLAWRANDRAGLALWAGVLVGVCGLFKIPSMVIGLPWVIGWLATMNLRETARRAFLLVAGTLLPWALAFGWFAAHGATGAFTEGVFVYHRYNVAFISPPWGSVLQQYATTMLTQAPLLLVAGGLGVFMLARRSARATHWAAAWILATMAAVVAERQLAGYQYMLAVPALAMVGAIGVVDVARTLRDRDSRALAAAALLGLALFAGSEGLSWWKAYAPDVACLTGRMPRADYLHAIQPGNFSMADEEAAARWVREATAPGDGLLVWGLSPGLYALADRHPVTRYPFHKILMTDAPLSRMWPGLDGRRADFLDRLRADPPVVVLVGQNDANGFEPQDSFASLGRFPALRSLLQRGYESAPPVGRFLVYRRVARDSAARTSAAPSATAP